MIPLPIIPPSLLQALAAYDRYVSWGRACGYTAKQIDRALSDANAQAARSPQPVDRIELAKALLRERSLKTHPPQDRASFFVASAIRRACRNLRNPE